MSIKTASKPLRVISLVSELPVTDTQVVDEQDFLVGRVSRSPSTSPFRSL